MPLDFSRLFQDSWNFIRNQQQFTFFSVLLLTLASFGMSFAMSKVVPADLLTQNLSSDQINIDAASVLGISLAYLLVNAWFHILIILNIKSISRGNYHHYFTNNLAVINYIAPVILFVFIMIMPISIAFSFGSILVSVNSAMGIIFLPLLISGLYIFIKLSLITYVYLLEEPKKRVSETFNFTWQLSRGRMVPLLLFCLVVYVAPLLLGGIFSGGQDLFSFGFFISHLINAFISLFTIIFGFRFYQAYRQ